MSFFKTAARVVSSCFVILCKNTRRYFILQSWWNWCIFWGCGRKLSYWRKPLTCTGRTWKQKGCRFKVQLMLKEKEKKHLNLFLLNLLLLFRSFFQHFLCFSENNKSREITRWLDKRLMTPICPQGPHTHEKTSLFTSNSWNPAWLSFSNFSMYFTDCCCLQMCTVVRDATKVLQTMVY